MKTKRSEDGKAVLLGVFAVLAIVVLPLAMIFAADITPGYTFISGEKNVTHTKLNSATAGSINTSFYSSKASGGTDPNQDFSILLHNTTTDEFVRSSPRVAFFDHTALLNGRTAKTSLTGADGILVSDSAAGGAYKYAAWSNALFAAATPTLPVTNEWRIPIMSSAGVVGSISLSNLIFGATSHNEVIGGAEYFLMMDGGLRLRKVSISGALFQAVTNGAFFSDDRLMAMMNGQYRQFYLSNLISGLPNQQTTFSGFEKIMLLDGASMKWGTLSNSWRAARIQNMVQSTYTGTTNIAGSSGNWSNVTAIGSSSLSNNITPRASSSKVLVRLTLHACANGNSQPGAIRLMRNGSPIAIGDDDGALRTEASAVIENQADPGTVVVEVLDSPSTTSAVSYYVEVKATTSTTLYINRSSGDANNENNSRVASTLMLTEVYQ